MSSRVAGTAEVAPEQHHRLLPGVRVAALPARPRIRVGAVHDRDDAIGPVEALEVLLEDRLSGPFRRRVLLGHEDLVPGGRRRVASWTLNSRSGVVNSGPAR